MSNPLFHHSLSSQINQLRTNILTNKLQNTINPISQGKLTKLELYNTINFNSFILYPHPTTKNYSLVLPEEQALTNNILLNDGSGNLSWEPYNSFDQSLNTTDKVKFVEVSSDITTELIKIKDNGFSISIFSNSLLSSYNINLPINQGLINTTLVNDGSGNLTWGQINPFDQELNTNNDVIFKSVELLDSNKGVKISVDSSTTNYTIKLPTNQGLSNTTLVNDGSGNLTWSNHNPFNQDLNTFNSPQFEELYLLQNSSNGFYNGSDHLGFRYQDNQVLKFYDTETIINNDNKKHYTKINTISVLEDAIQINAENGGLVSTIGQDIKISTIGTNKGIFLGAYNSGSQTIQLYSEGKITTAIDLDALGGINLHSRSSQIFIPSLPKTGSTANLFWSSKDGSVAFSTSSKKFKKDIENLIDEYKIIDSLQPVKFNFTSEDKMYYGLIAEDVHAINPQLVLLDSSSDPLSIDYNQIISLLIKYCQSLHNRLSLLEKN